MTALDEYIEAERRGWLEVERRMHKLASTVTDAQCWHLGDGEGGEVVRRLAEIFAEHGLTKERRSPGLYVKETIPHSVRWEVFKRDDFRCVDCGARDDLTVDHVEPESRGGSSTPDNFQTLCRSCNSRKGTS